MTVVSVQPPPPHLAQVRSPASPGNSLYWFLGRVGSQETPQVELQVLAEGRFGPRCPELVHAQDLGNGVLNSNLSKTKCIFLLFFSFYIKGNVEYDVCHLVFFTYWGSFLVRTESFLTATQDFAVGMSLS